MSIIIIVVRFGSRRRIFFSSIDLPTACGNLLRILISSLVQDHALDRSSVDRSSPADPPLPVQALLLRFKTAGDPPPREANNAQLGYLWPVCFSNAQRH